MVRHFGANFAGGASIGQVWTRHLAPAAPASRPSSPSQFHVSRGGGVKDPGPATPPLPPVPHLEEHRCQARKTRPLCAPHTPEAQQREEELRHPHLVPQEERARLHVGLQLVQRLAGPTPALAPAPDAQGKHDPSQRVISQRH